MKEMFSIGFLFFLVFTSENIVAQEKTGAGMLEVLVDGFKNDNGNAMIALCNSADCHKNSDNPLKGTMAPVKDGKAEWIISDLPYGTYTISIYHDENKNAKLDKNAFGIPKEKYGFSNNARGTFSIPKFEDALFVFDKAKMTVSITVK